MKMWFLALCVILASCTSEFEIPRRPSDVLESKKLEAVMVDVYLIEGRYQRRLRLKDDALKKMRPEELALTQYKQMFEKHGISKEQFEKSYDWYASYPSELEDIESRVLEKLQQMQANIDAGVEDLDAAADEKRKED